MADSDYILTSPRRVSALYDYSGENPHELAFHEGDTIEVVNTFNGAGWWYGKRDDKYGIFPSNYCAPAEQRRMKKRETTSIFIKKMQMELGFVKNNSKSESGEDTPPDTAEEHVAYQQMIMEMKDHIDGLEKQVAKLEDDAQQKAAIIEGLTAKLEGALLKELESQKESELQKQLIEVLEQNTTGAEEASSEILARVSELEESRKMLRTEIDELTTKLADALRREEDASFIMEEQQRQIVEHEESKRHHNELEEKLNSQLDEALKKEEEAYTALADLQRQLTEQDERQSSMLEKVTSQLEDALRKEEETDNIITEQQKLLTELDGSKQQFAEALDKVTLQLAESQKKEQLANNKVDELQEKIATYDVADGANEETHKMEPGGFVTTELLKRHNQPVSSDIAEAMIELRKTTTHNNRPRRNSALMFYFLAGLSVGVFATLSYRC